MSERDSINFAGQVIEFEVRRSRKRRKTIQISVNRNGVGVASPWRTSQRELRELVTKRAQWILERMAETQQRPAAKPLATGDSLPYRGDDLPLVVQHSGLLPPGAQLEDGRLCITTPAGLEADAQDEAVQRLAVAWYRERAAGWLAESVAEWWPRMGKGAGSRILVRDQRRRWGSCAADGTLRFNWRVAMLAPELAEYIVVHELAHLSVRNHSPNFWAVVAEALPEAQARRRQLREVERTLPLWN